MMTDILRKARAQKALKSRQGSETLEKIVERHAEGTKALLKTEFQGPPGHEEEYAMMSLFCRMNDDYHRRPYHCLPAEMTKRSIAYWKRVVKAAKSADVAPEVYLRAQFAYFHNNFGSSPKPEQLATDNAIMRAKEFAITQFKPKVFSNAAEFPIELKELFKVCEKQLQQLQKAHKLTRVQVYQQFVLSGMVYFPKSFLEFDPAFKEAKSV